LHVSAVQGPSTPPPVAPVPPVAAKTDNDGDNDNGAPEKVKSANPPGVGTKIDISA
jgi:hypothetical protein